MSTYSALSYADIVALWRVEIRRIKKHAEETLERIRETRKPIEAEPAAKPRPPMKDFKGVPPWVFASLNPFGDAGIFAGTGSNPQTAPTPPPGSPGNEGGG